MAVITATNRAQRHDTGDLIVRFYDLSGNNGDTFDAGTKNIRMVIVTPTTAISVGATYSGSIVTFISSGAWAAKVAVWSRVG